jgi:hypothetical protein
MNVATAPLRYGTLLANVRYKWITNGVAGSEQSPGITQPDTRFTLFRIAATSPPGTEEMLVYDVTDGSNWNNLPVL